MFSKFSISEKQSSLVPHVNDCLSHLTATSLLSRGLKRGCRQHNFFFHFYILNNFLFLPRCSQDFFIIPRAQDFPTARCSWWLCVFLYLWSCFHLHQGLPLLQKHFQLESLWIVFSVLFTLFSASRTPVPRMLGFHHLSCSSVVLPRAPPSLRPLSFLPTVLPSLSRVEGPLPELISSFLFPFPFTQLQRRSLLLAL